MQSELTGAVHRPPQDSADLDVRVTERGRPIGSGSLTRPDMVEFLGAFLIGVALGAGAMRLLQPSPGRGRDRIRKNLAPYRKKISKNTLAARRNFAAGADAASAAVGALGEAGRTLIRDLRAEVTEIIGSARSDLVTTVNEQVGMAVDSIRREVRVRERR